MIFKIDNSIKLEFNNLTNIKSCPYCSGTGKRKAMQSAMTSTGSIRGENTQIKCKFCNGTGLILK